MATETERRVATETEKRVATETERRAATETERRVATETESERRVATETERRVAGPGQAVCQAYGAVGARRRVRVTADCDASDGPPLVRICRQGTASQIRLRVSGPS